ncbi:hypothetical protein TRIP_D420104 [uncultured Paludibacter sp.]|uniref:Uncharacterized protein n=1 Tax=uncultured Paludibacter sp. TaxID=497635 RepID=A0A653AHA6_9BACT|nr:hypothetical protein TRIP_D420104 [uncultured Paludibacter sp.]
MRDYFKTRISQMLNMKENEKLTFNTV